MGVEGVESGGPALTKASVIPRKAAEYIFVYDPHTEEGNTVPREQLASHSCERESWTVSYVVDAPKVWLSPEGQNRSANARLSPMLG
jgi:hypothetical protein